MPFWQNQLPISMIEASLTHTKGRIFYTYKELFESLESKQYKPKMNVMNNQGTKYIKKFHTKKECNLQVVELHNHRMNPAKRAIQTFKDSFIAALATTDWEFPLQLWDKLVPQVQNKLNLLRASRIKPNISAYETLNGPYNWDHYPHVPLGCKAIIYEAPAVRGLWVLHRIDAWLLGALADHYRCNLYHFPEVSQHCQVFNLSNMAHLKALTKVLEISTTKVAKTSKGRAFI
jgi:hypothetical protein